MAVEAAYLMPHPPIVIPRVGGGREKEAAATTAGMEEVARHIAQARYETLLYVTPHGPAFSDGVALWDTASLSGSLQSFGARDVAFEKKIDRELTDAIAEELARTDILCARLNEKTANRYRVRPQLDHGILVPMSFIDAEYASYRIVALSVGGLAPIEHYRAGIAAATAARRIGVRCAVVISGDMSHRRSDDGPYGYHPKGPLFDAALDEAIVSGDLVALLTLPPSLVEPASECGYRPLCVGLGALDERRVEARLISSEAPFGVGYKTALFTAHEEAPSLLPAIARTLDERRRAARDREDGFIRLARAAIETFVGEGRVLQFAQIADGLAAAERERLAGERAGAFVSVHRDGRLRGCIGTTEPTCDTLAEEIIANAVSACSRDPRFDPVSEDELAELSVKVDVLFSPEPIEGPESLDPMQYGVIVSRGARRGLLLPALEGVETVEEQIRIAREKAGIGPAEPVRLHRFKVERHEVAEE